MKDEITDFSISFGICIGICLVSVVFILLSVEKPFRVAMRIMLHMASFFVTMFCCIVIL